MQFFSGVGDRGGRDSQVAGLAIGLPQALTLAPLEEFLIGAVNGL
jgi:hypothetical protein